MFDFNLSNCPHRYNPSLAREEEADLLNSIRLVAAGLEILIRSQPAPVDEICPALEEFNQLLVRMLN